MMRRLSAVLALMFFVMSWFCTPVLAAPPKSPTVVEQALGDSLAKASGKQAIQIIRKQIAPAIAEYVMTLKVGNGPYDLLGIHRVIKEIRPGVPMRVKEAVMMIPGDTCSFDCAFMTPVDSSGKTMATYLADQGLDVWGVDLRWCSVPDGITDFSFMKSWNTATHLGDIKIAVKTARVARALTGQGVDKIFLLGHSRGGQFVYAYANAEAKTPLQLQDLKGIIPMDYALKYAPDKQELIKAAETRYNTLKALYNQGIYVCKDGENLKGIAYLAATEPDGDSPAVPGLTNRQVALLTLTATYQTATGEMPAVTPSYHLLAGTFSDQVPDGLQFADEQSVLHCAMQAPSYQSLGEMIDGEAMAGETASLPYDDCLKQIKLPVFYIGAAGGFGEEGIYTTTLLGSKKVKTLVVRLCPPGLEVMDYGHADLLWASNAPELVWQPIADWVKSN